MKKLTFLIINVAGLACWHVDCYHVVVFKITAGSVDPQAGT